MKILLSCLVLLVLGTSYNVHAQAYFKSEYATASSFKDENNQETGGSGDMFKLQGGFSLPLSYKQYDNGRVKALAVSLDAAYGIFNNKGISTDLHPDNILNTTVSLTYLTPISNKWSLLAVLGGGVYSDPSKITAKSILGSGGALFVYHILDNLDIGVGVGVTNSYGVPMALPMGYINWHMDGKYEVRVNMLENMEISGAVKFNDWFKLRLIGFELDGMSAVMDVDGESKLFGTMSMKSGLQADFKIGKQSSIQITGGGNWYRDAVVVNRSIKDYFRWFGREFDPSFKTAGYFSIGYKYGF
ncbi:MAG: DUF6268 family outer membrane beta-barrel protein [Tannerellaceae bacterium]|jgi:hypothetical protein|nr:DUF6268 family outer membrane beta-barrel protein [Tannerellaceae bacterium]